MRRASARGADSSSKVARADSKVARVDSKVVRVDSTVARADSKGARVDSGSPVSKTRGNAKVAAANRAAEQAVHRAKTRI
ncbi:MAG: hypothetical protein NVS9B2_12980 [Steroidobacteraceae bacterium]